MLRRIYIFLIIIVLFFFIIPRSGVVIQDYTACYQIDNSEYHIVNDYRGLAIYNQDQILSNYLETISLFYRCSPFYKISINSVEIKKIRDQILASLKVSQENISIAHLCSLKRDAGFYTFLQGKLRL